MFRFISFLLGKPYEPCKSCEVLKYQLEVANAEKKEMLEALTSIVKPPAPQAVEVKALEPVERKFTTFSRRRAALEEASRQRAKAEENNLAAKPDNIQRSIEKLEEELGVVSASENG